MSDQLLADGEKKRKRVSLNIDTKMLKIGFIGGGKMAQALAKGFIRAGKNNVLYTRELLISPWQFSSHLSKLPF